MAPSIGVLASGVAADGCGAAGTPTSTPAVLDDISAGLTGACEAGQLVAVFDSSDPNAARVVGAVCAVSSLDAAATPAIVAALPPPTSAPAVPPASPVPAPVAPPPTVAPPPVAQLRLVPPRRVPAGTGSHPSAALPSGARLVLPAPQVHGAGPVDAGAGG